jgi:hypothetical protein
MNIKSGGKMANYLGQLEELSGNLEAVAGSESRDKVMEGMDTLDKKTKPDVIALWVKEAMDRMDQELDLKAGEEVMLRCGRNCAMVNSRPVEGAKKRRAKFKSLDEFLADEEKHPPSGMKFERAGDVVYQYYTPQAYSHPMRCFCGLMRSLPKDQTVSKTYCNCSRGFVQVWWEGILGHPVQVEVLETAISGSDVCKFAVHLPGA